MKVTPLWKTIPVRLKGPKLKQLYNDVFERDGYSCQNPRCNGTYPIDSAPHHIKFKSQGGSDTMRNLITLCMECHDMIHSRGTLHVHMQEGEPFWIYRPKKGE